MRILTLVFINLFLLINLYSADFEQTKLEASQQNKPILLVFSGSDWCAPCIQYKKNILDAEAFKVFADSSVLLVYADFPRLKKNQLAPAQQKENETLADQYNPKGYFPYTVLLNKEGKVIRSWEGKPGTDISNFIQEIVAALENK